MLYYHWFNQFDYSKNAYIYDSLKFINNSSIIVKRKKKIDCFSLETYFIKS